MLWHSPTSALTCLLSASPRSCQTISHIWARPVAPTGWPLAFKPPDGFIGSSPPSPVLPSTTALMLSPGLKKPISSGLMNSRIVNASCTSATSMSFGCLFAISYARLAATFVAVNEVKVFLCCSERISVAWPMPVIFTSVLSDVSTTAHAPSLIEAQSYRCSGSAIILLFSTSSTVISF